MGGSRKGEGALHGREGEEVKAEVGGEEGDVEVALLSDVVESVGDPMGGVGGEYATLVSVLRCGRLGRWEED